MRSTHVSHLSSAKMSMPNARRILIMGLMVPLRHMGMMLLGPSWAWRGPTMVDFSGWEAFS